jgi:hypothetical protein
MAIAVTLLLYVITKNSNFQSINSYNLRNLFASDVAVWNIASKNLERYQASLLTNLSPLWWALVRFLF